MSLYSNRVGRDAALVKREGDSLVYRVAKSSPIKQAFSARYWLATPETTSQRSKIVIGNAFGWRVLRRSDGTAALDLPQLDAPPEEALVPVLLDPAWHLAPGHMQRPPCV